MATEKRLIDANALYLGKFVDAGMSDYKNGWNDALDAATTQADTVDAVEVVRCKDCKFYQTDHWCTRVAIGIMYEDDFCSYGERRTDNA